MTDEETISKLNAEIRTIRAQWIGMKDENDSLMTQIEYLNKAAKEDHDKIKKLEFELKQERNKVQELRDELKKFSKALVTRDGNLTSKLLIEERERLMTVIEYAFVAGRGKTSWAQFKKDHEI